MSFNLRNLTSNSKFLIEKKKDLNIHTTLQHIKENDPPYLPKILTGFYSKHSYQHTN